ncbi:hypothetical protein BH11PSE11_BH11PSE11_16870 [soil metagenome]
MAYVHELRRIRASLRFASKLLLFALLLELPFVGMAVVRVARPTWVWQFPDKLFWLLYFPSTLFAIVGFMMVCKQLGLWSDAMDSLTDLVDRTRLLGTAKLAAGAQLLFIFLFLLPLFNLPMIFWARAQAGRAGRDIDGVTQSARRK